VQSGTHAELIEQSGLYQSLWDRHTIEQVVELT
jgi:ABC-type multidrug transport system fused ATPase/permease subunit